MAEKKEIIVYDELFDAEGDTFMCHCGNTSHLEGFHPCLEDGTNVEPELKSGWVDLYKCDRCGQIYRSMND